MSFLNQAQNLNLECFFCWMISSREIASVFGELGFGSRVLLDCFQVYLPFTKPFSSRETIGVSDLVLEATLFQEMAREIWLTKLELRKAVEAPA